MADTAMAQSSPHAVRTVSGGAEPIRILGARGDEERLIEVYC